MSHSHNSRSHRFFSAYSAARLLLMVMVALTVMVLTAHAQRRSSGTTYSSSTMQSSSSSSSHVTFGGEFGLNYKVASQEGTIGTGVGFQIGGLVDLPIAPQTGVLLSAGYQVWHIDGIANSDLGTTLNTSQTGSVFALTGQVRHDVSQNVSINGGLTVQFLNSAHIDYLTGSERLRVAGFSPTQFGLVAGAGYTVNLSPTMNLVPNVALNYFLTSGRLDGASSHYAILVGARLMFK